VVVAMLQMRLIPAADQRHLPCPGGRFTAKPGEQAAQLRPMRRGGRGRPEPAERSKVPPGSAEVRQRLPRDGRTDARQQLHDAERRQSEMLVEESSTLLAMFGSRGVVFCGVE
jgi:hypothetical protein